MLLIVRCPPLFANLVQFLSQFLGILNGIRGEGLEMYCFQISPHVSLSQVTEQGFPDRRTVERNAFPDPAVHANGKGGFFFQYIDSLVSLP